MPVLRLFTMPWICANSQLLFHVPVDVESSAVVLLWKNNGARGTRRIKVLFQIRLNHGFLDLVYELD